MRRARPTISGLPVSGTVVGPIHVDGGTIGVSQQILTEKTEGSHPNEGESKGGRVLTPKAFASQAFEICARATHSQFSVIR
jgi:hypothetical protein